MVSKKPLWSFWIIIFFVTISVIAYVNDVNNDRVTTTVVTWIVLITASLLNLGVVIMRDGRSALALNILIILGIIGQTVILVFVLWNDASTDITLLDMVVFAGSFIGFAIFLWKREHAIISVLLINGVIFSAFIPMWTHLWNGGVTESLTAWACIAVASILSSQKPLNERKYLALVYPVRSTLTSSIVVGLSLWNMYF